MSPGTNFIIVKGNAAPPAAPQPPAIPNAAPAAADLFQELTRPAAGGAVSPATTPTPTAAAGAQTAPTTSAKATPSPAASAAAGNPSAGSADATGAPLIKEGALKQFVYNWVPLLQPIVALAHDASTSPAKAGGLGNYLSNLGWDAKAIIFGGFGVACGAVTMSVGPLAISAIIIGAAPATTVVTGCIFACLGACLTHKSLISTFRKEIAQGMSPEQFKSSYWGKIKGKTGASGGGKGSGADKQATTAIDEESDDPNSPNYRYRRNITGSPKADVPPVAPSAPIEATDPGATVAAPFASAAPSAPSAPSVGSTGSDWSASTSADAGTSTNSDPCS